jgi:hypothetical protein
MLPFTSSCLLMMAEITAAVGLLPGQPPPPKKCSDYGAPLKGWVCHSDTCLGTGGHCGHSLAEPKLDLSGGCDFTSANMSSLRACTLAAAKACDAQAGCRSFALDPKWHGSVPAAKLFSAAAPLTANVGWDVWVKASSPPPGPPPGPAPSGTVADLPIAYLGSATEEDFDKLCRFQVVSVIDSPCWSKASAPAHAICTNNTNEEGRIIAISTKLRQRCPGVFTQMYLNSLMDFYWYDLSHEFRGENASQLLHDIDGALVTVNQDGGAGPQPVFDWGQAATRTKYMALVDRALVSGISGFFLDKASTSTRNSTQLCNHVCANLSAAVGTAWDAGHLQVLRAIQAKSPGPTVGNTGFATCAKMRGCVQERVVRADQQGIEQLADLLAQNGTNSVFVHFPMTTAGYAAFLMAHVHGRSFFWWYNGKPSYSGWLPEFDHTLGVPVGNATLARGVYSRSFSSGTKVTFDTRTNQGDFSWAGPGPPVPPPTCKVFPRTDFAGHDLTEEDANTPAECCSFCSRTAGCGFYTFVPPVTCSMKTSNAGKRPSPTTGAGAYTSGCRFANCTAVPLPPPNPPPPPQVCTTGTVCGAKFSVNGKGCCPYENAVCCSNNMTCCPHGSTCELHGWQSTCVGAPAARVVGQPVCKTGAALPFSKTKPNILIIGDSVSIGYTPKVAAHMAPIAFVQHSPWDVRDGGAEETAYGVTCLKYMLHSPGGEYLRPDVVMFNWGLHDGPLGNVTQPGQAGLPAVYAAELENITIQLKAMQPQAKLLFAGTTAYMCSAQQDGCVVNLNNQAAAIMARHDVPMINLHDAITGECGSAPNASCFGAAHCFCPHCSPDNGVGYEFLAKSIIVPALNKMIKHTPSPPPPAPAPYVGPCTSALNCSLNGDCDRFGKCLCVAPWSGPRCGQLKFAEPSPKEGRDLYNISDMQHNTWNGPIIQSGDSTYHMYLPLYPAGLLYHPVALMLGTASSMFGPWSWRNLSGGDLPTVVDVNPGALVFDSKGKTVYSLWTAGSIYVADAPSGPFTLVPGSNSSGCKVNASPLFAKSRFFCIGQKGATIMTAPALGGPWTVYSKPPKPHGAEDPFLYQDQKNSSHWHALYHASSYPQVDNCGSSRVSAHIFSQDSGVTWHALEPEVQPYKPKVRWTDGEQTFATMERPHLYFDAVGRITHLGAAAALNIGDEGCEKTPNCKPARQQGHCPCVNCKYVSHAGSVLIELASN